METLYVWLFFFAGATMIVQGILLLASERELRKQRREIDMYGAITSPPSIKRIHRRN
jgi:hypothetical protein